VTVEWFFIVVFAFAWMIPRASGLAHPDSCNIQVRSRMKACKSCNERWCFSQRSTRNLESMAVPALAFVSKQLDSTNSSGLCQTHLKHRERRIRAAVLASAAERCIGFSAVTRLVINFPQWCRRHFMIFDMRSAAGEPHAWMATAQPCLESGMTRSRGCIMSYANGN
jgi:hypothetical protein